MNKRQLIKLLSIIGLCMALGPLVMGCKAIFGSPDNLKADVTDAVRIGTKLDLGRHPEHRAAYEQAYKALVVVIDNKTITGGTLTEIIQGLPLHQFSGSQGELILEAGSLVFNRLAGTKLNLDKAPYVEAAAEGARDGLKVALGL